jgi:toxin secretion/phage lysis holin
MTHMDEFKVEKVKEVFVNIVTNTHIKVALSAISFIGEFIFKAHEQALLTVFLLIVLDTITGVIKAAKGKRLGSREFFRVAVKLVIYSILMACASLVDKALPLVIAMPIMYTFLAVTEGISILENVGEAGFPIPTKILSTLKVMQKESK